MRDAHAEALHQVGGQSHGAVLEAVQVACLGDFALEPAEGLGEHRKAQQAHHVQAHFVLGQFAIKLAAAAGVEPGQHRRRAAAENRAGAEQRGGLVLAVPVDRYRVRGVEYAVADRVHDLECLDHRARRQQVDLQPPARHPLDAVGVFTREIHPDIGRRPRGLHFHDDRGRAGNDGRRAQDGGSGTRCRGQAALEKLAPAADAGFRLGIALAGRCVVRFHGIPPAD